MPPPVDGRVLVWTNGGERTSHVAAVTISKPACLRLHLLVDGWGDAERARWINNNIIVLYSNIEAC